MTEVSDKVLWEKIRDGNQIAFRQLYERHVDALHTYAYKFTTDRQVLEDCCQELFVKIWKKREALPDMEQPIRYLYRAMRNNLIKQLQRKENKYVGGVEEYVFDWTPAADKGLIEEEEEREQQRRLKMALEELPARQKEAMYLKYQKGMEYDEICEIMDVNYQSARNLISRALSSLRDILGAGLLLLLIKNMMS